MRELIPLMLIIVALENILRGGGWALQIFNFRRCTSWGSITDSWTCNLGCIFYFNSRKLTNQ